MRSSPWRRARFTVLAPLLILISLPAWGQYVPNRYALVLADPPVASQYATRDSLRSTAAVSYQDGILRAQSSLRTQLGSRNAIVTGSTSTLLNAVFAVVPPDRVDEVKALPGVLAMIPMRRGKRFVNAAATLVNAPAAWASAAIGGKSNGGKGIKIGILDTGIDLNHPAFQDSTLPSAGAKYPICTAGHPEDCAYTNSKVIVARSYVRQAAMGWVTDPANPAAESQPDDYSPRDLSGHGSGVASVAAGNTDGTGTVTINGIAPKAYLGNYKIYGTPGVNDYPPEDVWIQAIEDALNDGMDIVNFSSGFPALTGPLDTGAACGLAAGAPCDPLAAAFESAVQHGMVIVAAAGNSGTNYDATKLYPVFGSIGSPANAPSVITVGATVNSHTFGPSVSMAGPGAPSNLQKIAARPSDSIPTYTATGAVSAPLVDVALIGDVYACSPLPENSLFGAFALVQRSVLGSATVCTFADKAAYAAAAGAIGVILYNSPDGRPWNTSHPAYDYIESVDGFAGPLVGITNAQGKALADYVDTVAIAAYKADSSKNPWPVAMIDLSGVEQAPDAAANTLAGYSSFGPSLGALPGCSGCTAPLIKPELVATGGGDPNLYPDPNDGPLYGFPGMYMAAQSFYAAGDLYSANGYGAADGTSFASPIVAGAAALVKQAHPSYTPAQIKSALVNWANSLAVTRDDMGGAVDLRQTGAGLLDAAAAVGATVTAEPATVSFGAVAAGASLPAAQTVKFTNAGAAAVTLSFAVAAQLPATGASVTATPQSLPLAAGASGTVTFSITGTMPAAGAYTGAINVTGAGAGMHLPYQFLVGSGAVGSGGNVVPVFGTFLQGFPNTDMGAVQVQLLDAAGVAVTGSSVTFSARGAPVSLRSVTGKPACTPATSASSVTCPSDRYGMAYVDVLPGSSTGTATINVTSANSSPAPLSVSIIPRPAAAAALDAARGNPAIAPGSYISIYGSSLTVATELTAASTLPLSLNDTTVTFDVPSAGASYPGRMLYVSASQVNVQVPWELKGLPAGTTVQVKVTRGQYLYGNVITAKLAETAPAFFENAGTVAALSADTGAFIDSSNKAVKGGKVQLYANGLGRVQNQPESGSPASGLASTTINAATVTIGAQSAAISFSGLAPGTPALYRVDVTVPAGVDSGNQTVSLSIGGQTATSTLPVQ